MSEVWYYSTYGKQMSTKEEQNLNNKTEFYIVDKRVLPEVFIKVTEAKRLMEADSVKTVQDAVNAVGISRSAFYKYKDYVMVLGENRRGRIMTIAFNLKDSPGLLSNVLNVIAGDKVNILTINQTIPINNIANVTISVDIGNHSVDIVGLIDKLRQIDGVMTLKIIARE